MMKSLSKIIQIDLIVKFVKEAIRLGKDFREFNKAIKYMCSESSPEQDLQGIMNDIDRLFVAGRITKSYWYHHQMAAIDKYKKKCLKK